ncbi:FRAS1-related extracellular matrix protein 2 [Caerostris extrusa]|uniref:FRAS1-related extracellular matrix protein 2 n=1 Tax=Caerostris extrusa TaxID=172846 RepID=A0AAV4NRG6_CAEEX|nr:FRAS1-related extracellular matrix protein 2 [Caerostris extrusa]
MGNPVKHFSPGDLDDGRIIYEHDGSDTYSDNIIFRLNDGQHQVEFLFPVTVHSGDRVPFPLTERIRFKLSDDNIPPNESTEQEFLIRIMPLDNTPPDVDPSAPLQMTVEEFQLTDLTKQHMLFTDADTSDRDLVIKITKKPFDTDENNPMDPGKIVF